MLERYTDWHGSSNPGSVHGRIRQWAQRSPDAPALLSPAGRSLTYRQLAAELDRFADRLARSGIGPGNRVAVVMPPGIDEALAILAVTGHAACAPLNPGYAAPEYEFYLSRLNPDAIVAPSGSPALSVARARGIPLLPSGWGAFEDDPPGRADDIGGVEHDDADGEAAPSLLLFTSGTTGRAKLVALTSAQLAFAAGNISAALELGDADRCFGVMPLFHIHGLSTLFATLSSGGSYVCLTGFSSVGLFDDLQIHRPTWYSASPAIHRAILDVAPPERPAPTTLRFVRSASAPMPAPLAARIEETLGVPLVEAYGMTEAAPIIATNRLPPYVRKQGSVGRPAGPEVAIVDAAGQLLPADETGEIVIRGPNVIERYEGETASNEAFHGTWLRTGDLGRLDTDGFLFVQGRSKDIINRGGEKIAPGWIEEALLEHPGVADAVVFGVADPVLGEAVAAAIVLTPDAIGAVGTSEIRNFVATRRARFEVPRDIVVVETIPMHVDGKVRRRDLAETLGLGQGGRPAVNAGNAVPLRTPTEMAVAAAFAEVLGSPPPGLHADFFELGGNSLSAMQVMVRLGATFGINLPVEVLFANPTVDGLAARLGRVVADLLANGERRLAPNTPASPPPRDDRFGATSLSAQQSQVYFLEQIGSGAAYTMSASLSLSGALDRDALARALHELSVRHEALRTRFVLDGDRPVQIVDPPLPQSAIETIDLGGLPKEARALEADRLAEEAASRPFDLADGPLFRFALVRLSDDEWHLLLTIHHIVCDGWSIRILHEELKQLYGAFRLGRPSPLPALDSRYADYVAWQERSDQAADREYWIAALDKAPPENTFPGDRPRSSVRDYVGGIVRERVEPRVVERLNAIARGGNATLFMVLLAAFQTLLFRHNRQEDSVVGVPVANRPSPEFEPVVGFFANSVALRTSLADDPSFMELLSRTREAALGAFAHQGVPLERIVADLNLARDPARSPLFQVMFAFRNRGISAEGKFDLAPGLVARPLDVGSRETKFDLTLYLSETADGLLLEWQFNRGLFDSNSIRDVAHQYCAVLEAVVAAPDRKVSQLPLLSPAEAQEIEAAWNRVEAGTTSRTGFVELFDSRAALAPDRLAVLGGGSTFTYGELVRRANQLARYFLGLGVRDSETIGVCLPRTPEAVAVQLGIWKAGGTYLPLDPRYPASHTAFAIKDAGARFIITTTDLLPTVHAATAFAVDGSARKPVVVCLDAVETQVAALATAPLDQLPAAEALAYVIYTSGSTGTPKGVAITHGNVSHYAEALPQAIGLDAADRYLHTASFSFSSSVRQVVAPLATGAAVVLATEDEMLDPQALLTTIRDSGATIVDLVPSFSAACIEVLRSLDEPARIDLVDNSVRLMLSASEPLPTALVSAWRALLSPATRFVNMFGQTETTGIVLTYTIPDGPGARPIVPVGSPIANTDAYILDGARQVVPAGVCGELYIGGDGVGRGYINGDVGEETGFVTLTLGGAPRRLFRTGDLARYRHDGVIEFIGRTDRQVKVRGFRVELEQIELAIRAFDGVRECTVGLELGDLATPAEHLFARFVHDSVPLDDAALVRRLRGFLRQKLPPYMVPERIVRVAALPRTPGGKLDLRAPPENGPATLSGSIPPGVPASDRPPDIESAMELIAIVWRKVLRLEAVGVEHNFFDLGGNSRLCISVMVEAKSLGLNLTLDQIYRHQTIADLARSATGHGTDGKAASSPIYRGEPEDTPLLTVDSLRAFGREALIRAGLDREGAAIVTEVQLEASLRGQQTHDMVSIPRYASRIAAGRINPNPRIRIERETPTAATVDGDNGPGQWVSTVAMSIAIRKANEHGIGIVTARRSNHFGAAGHYVWEATRSGFIGLCTTNGPAVLAPTGGVTPTFGNNPLAIGAPAGRNPPILLDIAMSVAPRSKIGLAVGEGNALPSGWILDRSGQPSTDLGDLAAGLGVPIGGHKGYGLAMALEVLSGVLSGAGFGAAHRPDVLRDHAAAPDFGHLFIAIDPQLFLGAADFVDRVDRLVEETRRSDRAIGVEEILIPGERELRSRERSLRDGVRLRPSTYRVLLDYGRRMGLESVLLPAAAAAKS